LILLNNQFVKSNKSLDIGYWIIIHVGTKITAK